MTQLKQLIEEMILETLSRDIPAEFKGLTYKKTHKDVVKAPGEDDDGESHIYYDILDSSKNKIGEVKNWTFLGTWYGHLYNKTFNFDGNDVRAGGEDPKKNMEAWFKTKSFQKWVANIDKYKSLKSPTNDYRLKVNKK